MSNSETLEHKNVLEIAIIGMAGRFPGARNIEQFWQNMRDGIESISFFTDQELESAGVTPAELSNLNYVKARGALEDIDLFDATFFGINPNEAEMMDPQQRLFLECAWEALENSGYDSETYTGSIGVYAGLYNNTYLLDLYSNPGLVESVGDFLIRICNEKDYLTTRVAYKLNLKGPAVTVQTACSTSLVAVHLACQSLLSGTCDIALAGGVSIKAQQKTGYIFQEEGTLSPDGHCRAFDAKAQGFVSSNGVGIVVLKRLEDALADGDHVHAVIKGSAINNDASRKVGYTAPSVVGQAEVIRAAQIMAEVEPETVTYIEAHGSATPLGDPIEVTALTRAFRTKTQRRSFCAVGSVKTNIGHVHTAAGVAGVIKTVLALENKMIPPSLHLEQPNPKIDFKNSPFYVNTKLSEWKTDNLPRRAGVSSFGLGGTNAHVVLEEVPPQKPSEESGPWQLLILSAKTSSALETATDNLVEYFKQHPDLSLADAAYTLQVGRRAFNHRRMLICHDLEDGINALEKRDPQRLLSSVQETSDRPIAFMFPGLGDHYVNMGLELYQFEPLFREQIDRCSELLEPHLGLDLRTVLYPNMAQAGEVAQEPSHPSAPHQGLDLRKMLRRDDGQADEATQKLKQTCLAQPVVFAIEYALAQLWMAWGVRPQAMIGYSIGEYVAACLAGVFSLEDALFLVANRARMIRDLPVGAMLAIPLPEEEVVPLLGGELSLSAVNGPFLCVVAGPTDAIVELEHQLTKKEVIYRRLQTSHAFHSKMMEPLSEPSTELVKNITLKPPQIPYISTVTGDWITTAEATDPSYWARHMCQAVRFADGIEKLWQAPGRVLLEVGPGRALGSLAMQHPASAADPIALPSIRHSYDQQSDLMFLLNTLGKLWLAGIPLDWPSLYAYERRHRIPLPTYPFERRRHWVDLQKQADSDMAQEPLRKRPNIADWFYTPSWKRSIHPVSFELGDLVNQTSRWLVFVDECGVGTGIVERLEQLSQDVTTVIVGERLSELDNRTYIINPREPDDYDALLKGLRQLDKLPQTIIHLWSVTPNDSVHSRFEFFEQAQECGFYSILFLAQALAKQNVKKSLHIDVVSNNMHAVTGEEVLHSEKATLLGPCKVLPQEHPHITCSSIDIVIPQSETEQEKLIDHLIIELATQPSDPIVAYRGQHRWLQTYEAVQVDSTDGCPKRLREGGVYLITGGLGGMGLVLAEYLAQTVQAKLILTGRSALPPRDEWQVWVATHDGQDDVSRKIRKVQALEKLGAEVLVVSADVANQAQMQDVKSQAYQRFGKINGIIHAAGIAGGGMIQLKSPEMADRVLSPKAKGALVLEAIFKDVKLDFLVLCSSTFSITGGFGQVDYCAANAYLDTFAQRNAVSDRWFTVSINWDAWQKVGMAFNTLGQSDLKKSRLESRGEAMAHPLLDECLLQTSDREIYATKFSVTKGWILDEHRMLGRAVIPGTAYLEMVRAAFEKHAQDGMIELRELAFLTPVVAGDSETKEVHLIIEKKGDIFNFSFIGKYESEDDKALQWQEHVRGKITRLDVEPHKKRDVRDIIEKHNLMEINKENLVHPGPMGFGPRSQCLERLYAGANEALAFLELPEPFSADLKEVILHPSLMDIATGSTNLYLSDDFYMPLAYKRLRIKGPLSRKIYSYLRYKDGKHTRKETLTFDIVIMDEHGTELVEIEEFTMKKVSDLEAKLAEWAQQVSLPVARYQYSITDHEPSVVAGNTFRQHLEEGILPGEGAEAFRRVLSGNVPPQIVVTTKDLQAMIEQVDAFTHSHVLEETEKLQFVTPTHPRPNVRTAYIAPRNELERSLANIWQELLGIKQVGVRDNFFELGGHSLLGIRLISRLRQTFEVDLPLHSLFETPTIADLSLVIQGD